MFCFSKDLPRPWSLLHQTPAGSQNKKKSTKGRKTPQRTKLLLLYTSHLQHPEKVCDRPPGVSYQRINSEIVEEHAAIPPVVELQRRRGPAALYLPLQGGEDVRVRARPLDCLEGLPFDSLLKIESCFAKIKTVLRKQDARDTDDDYPTMLQKTAAGENES